MTPADTQPRMPVAHAATRRHRAPRRSSPARVARYGAEPRTGRGQGMHPELDSHRATSGETFGM